MGIDVIAFTGHRPQAFGSEEDIAWVKFQLGEMVYRLIRDGARRFISGGALGVDQWAAETVLSLREGISNCTLTIARPFPNQDARWSSEQRRAYRHLCQLANEVVDVSPGPYASWKYIARDKWMVDEGEVLVAVWDGRLKGGTYQTCSYAQRRLKPIYRIDPLKRTGEWI